MTDPSAQRRFCVRAVGEAVSRAQLLTGLGFEDAALHFLEDHHPDAEDDEVRLYVEALDTGERQCFRIDLATGETGPCD